MTDAVTVRDPASKVMSWDAARAWLDRWRRAQGDGRHGGSGGAGAGDRTAHRVVFTNGVFDLLHPGHIDVLWGARRTGGALVVGLNSDASVRRLNKGPERPVRSEADRAYVLAALEAVDVVTVFDQDTPLELIRALRPDIIVKGGDYTPDTIVGAAEVQRWGGEVVVIPLTPNQSTTSIINTLRGTSSRNT